MKTIKVKTSYVPFHSLDYLTPDKVYKAVQITGTLRDLYNLVGDDKCTYLIRVSGCCHLDGLPWEVVEEENNA